MLTAQEVASLEAAGVRHDHLRAVQRAGTLGLSLLDLFALVAKYGPVALDILNYVADRFRASDTPPVA